MFMYLSKKLNKKNRGFTLVELVVVIAIIAILAAIAIPQLLGFKTRAEAQADNQTGVQVRNAVALLYANGEINVAADDSTVTLNHATGAITGVGVTKVSTDVAVTLESLIKSLTGPIASLKGTRDIIVTIDTNGSLEMDLK